MLTDTLTMLRRTIIIGFLAFASVPLRAEEPKPRVLAIEEAMRALSEQQYAQLGSYPSWPSRSLDGAVPSPFPVDGFYGDDLLDDSATYNLVSQIYFRTYDVARSSLRSAIVAGGDPAQLVFMSDEMPSPPTPTDFADVFAQLQPILKRCDVKWGAKGALSATPNFPATYTDSYISDSVTCSTAIEQIQTAYQSATGWQMTSDNDLQGVGSSCRTIASLRSVTDTNGQPASAGGISTLDGSVLLFFDKMPRAKIGFFGDLRGWKS